MRGPLSGEALAKQKLAAFEQLQPELARLSYPQQGQQQSHVLLSDSPPESVSTS